MLETIPSASDDQATFFLFLHFFNSTDQENLQQSWNVLKREEKKAWILFWVSKNNKKSNKSHDLYT